MSIIFAWENEARNYGNPKFTHIVWHSSTGRIWRMCTSEEHAINVVDLETEAYRNNPDFQFHFTAML